MPLTRAKIGRKTPFACVLWEGPTDSPRCGPTCGTPSRLILHRSHSASSTPSSSAPARAWCGRRYDARDPADVRAMCARHGSSARATARAAAPYWLHEHRERIDAAMPVPSRTDVNRGAHLDAHANSAEIRARRGRTDEAVVDAGAVRICVFRHARRADSRRVAILGERGVARVE